MPKSITFFSRGKTPIYVNYVIAHNTRGRPVGHWVARSPSWKIAHIPERACHVQAPTRLQVTESQTAAWRFLWSPGPLRRRLCPAGQRFLRRRSGHRPAHCRWPRWAWGVKYGQSVSMSMRSNGKWDATRLARLELG